jgi:hypothetical protein
LIIAHAQVLSGSSSWPGILRSITAESNIIPWFGRGIQRRRTSPADDPHRIHAALAESESPKHPENSVVAGKIRRRRPAAGVAAAAKQARDANDGIGLATVCLVPVTAA